MLVNAFFSLRNEDRMYTFNPENVLYIDPDGVLFAKDVYRQFVAGEYENVMIAIDQQLDNVNDV
jgi:hypothetical protein